MKRQIATAGDQMLSRRSVLLGGLGVAGCGILTQSYTYRYRLNLTVNIDHAERTAATVLETKWVDTAGWNQGLRWVPKTWGDAFFFPLSSSSALVGLLGSMQDLPDGLVDLVLLFGSFARSAGRSPEGLEMILKEIKDIEGEYELPRKLWPYLLYLPDIRSLKSAELISPSSDTSRFSVSKITMRLTQEPVSRGIEEKIPCLEELSERRIDPKFKGDPITLPPYQLVEWSNVRADGGYL